jgi:hypothetical protein
MRLKVHPALWVACACLVIAMAAATARIGLAQTGTTGKAPAKSQATQPAPRAQPAAKREMLQITVVKIKPELVTEWVDFQKNETIPMLKKAGATRRDAWQTATFGEGFMYAFVTPIENLSQYDGEAPPVRALGAEGARTYGEKNRRFVLSTHTYLEQTRPDLSYEVKMTGPPKLALLSDIQIALGKGTDYEALIKSDVLPVMKKARLGYAVSQTMLGGDVNGFTTLIFYDNFAEIGKGHPFLRVLGAEGERQLTAKAAGIVTHVERNIIRYVPDLSFAPRPTS